MKNIESESQHPSKERLKPRNAREFIKWLVFPIVYEVLSPFEERRIAKQAKKAIQEYEQNVIKPSRE